MQPPTDDRPYYHHFFRWRQVPDIWQSLGHTWQPFGGGGYLVLMALFAAATLASGMLILLPLAFRRRAVGAASRLPRHLVLAYFGCLGVAYLAIEIPLIQRFVLLVDHPTIAFVAVVAVLLVSSGLGSLLAPRLRVRSIIPLLVLYMVLLLLALATASDLLLGRSLVVRLLAGCGLLVPLGLLMGVPFPAGASLLRAHAPHLIPWAWGVNGCTSVIASILSALIALDVGFNAVFGLAGLSYLLAWGTLHRIERAIRRGGESIV